jgi:hypothetical protein
MTDISTREPEHVLVAPAGASDRDPAERRIQALLKLYRPAASGSPEDETRVRAAFLRATFADRWDEAG